MRTSILEREPRLEPPRPSISERTLGELAAAQGPGAPCFCCGAPLSPRIGSEGAHLLCCPGCGAEVEFDDALEFRAGDDSILRAAA